MTCSADFKNVVKKICGDFDENVCLGWEDEGIIEEECGEGGFCFNGACVESNNVLTCEKKVISEMGCVWNFDDECNDHDGGERTRSCGFLSSKDEYECWDMERWESECKEDPVCPSGYYEVEDEEC